METHTRSSRPYGPQWLKTFIFRGLNRGSDIPSPPKHIQYRELPREVEKVNRTKKKFELIGIFLFLVDRFWYLETRIGSHGVHIPIANVAITFAFMATAATYYIIKWRHDRDYRHYKKNLDNFRDKEAYEATRSSNSFGNKQLYLLIKKLTEKLNNLSKDELQTIVGGLFCNELGDGSRLLPLGELREFRSLRNGVSNEYTKEVIELALYLAKRISVITEELKSKGKKPHKNAIYQALRSTTDEVNNQWLAGLKEKLHFSRHKDSLPSSSNLKPASCTSSSEHKLDRNEAEEFLNSRLSSASHSRTSSSELFGSTHLLPSQALRGGFLPEKRWGLPLKKETTSLSSSNSSSRRPSLDPSEVAQLTLTSFHEALGRKLEEAISQSKQNSPNLPPQTEQPRQTTLVAHNIDLEKLLSNARASSSYPYDEAPSIDSQAEPNTESTQSFPKGHSEKKLSSSPNPGSDSPSASNSRLKRHPSDPFLLSSHTPLFKPHSRLKRSKRLSRDPSEKTLSSPFHTILQKNLEATHSQPRKHSLVSFRLGRPYDPNERSTKTTSQLKKSLTDPLDLQSQSSQALFLEQPHQGPTKTTTQEPPYSRKQISSTSKPRRSSLDPSTQQSLPHYVTSKKGQDHFQPDNHLSSPLPQSKKLHYSAETIGNTTSRKPSLNSLESFSSSTGFVPITRDMTTETSSSPDMSNSETKHHAPHQRPNIPQLNINLLGFSTHDIFESNARFEVSYTTTIRRVDSETSPPHSARSNPADDRNTNTFSKESNLLQQRSQSSGSLGFLHPILSNESIQSLPSTSLGDTSNSSSGTNSTSSSCATSTAHSRSSSLDYSETTQSPRIKQPITTHNNNTPVGSEKPTSNLSDDRYSARLQAMEALQAVQTAINRTKLPQKKPTTYPPKASSTAISSHHPDFPSRSPSVSSLSSSQGSIPSTNGDLNFPQRKRSQSMGARGSFSLPVVIHVRRNGEVNLEPIEEDPHEAESRYLERWNTPEQPEDTLTNTGQEAPKSSQKRQSHTTRTSSGRRPERL